MPRRFFGLHPSTVPHIASTIDLCITIQQFPVISTGRDAHSVLFSWNRGKIQGTDHDIQGVFGPPEMGNGRLFAVMKIDPLKPGPIKIHLMERRLRGIQPIQVSDIPL